MQQNQAASVEHSATFPTQDLRLALTFPLQFASIFKRMLRLVIRQGDVVT
jgi:hypothetical protein